MRARAWGRLRCGPTEAMITDENLREICRVDVRAADVAEAGR